MNSKFSRKIIINNKRKVSMKNKTENLRNKKNEAARKNLRKTKRKIKLMILISNISLPLKIRHAKKSEYS
jgi:hypothetical protein